MILFTRQLKELLQGIFQELVTIRYELKVIKGELELARVKRETNTKRQSGKRS